MIAQIVAVATATKKALMRENKKKKKRNKPPVTCISGKKKLHTTEIQKEGEFKEIITKLL